MSAWALMSYVLLARGAVLLSRAAA